MLKKYGKRLFVIALIVAVASFFAFMKPKNGRGSPELLTIRQLDSAIGNWNKKGLSSYSFDLVQRGALSSQYHIVVRDNLVVEMNDKAGTLSSPESWPSWSMPGLFRTMRASLSSENGPYYAKFDPTYFYPKIYLRQGKVGAPREAWEIMNFTAGP